MNAARKTVLVVAFTSAAVSLPAALPARAETRALVLDPAASKVSFTLPATGHDVEGAFAVQSGRVTFDPKGGEASGQIAVDLKSAETGNGSRDKTMHGQVLESGAYPVALLRIDRLEGAVAPSGPSQVTLHGTLSLHGAEHKVSLPARINVGGGRLAADTELTIPYVEWGMHDPSIAFLRVAKSVAVKIHAEGKLEDAAAAAAGQR